MEQAIHTMLLTNYYNDIQDYDVIPRLRVRLIDLAKIHYKENDWSDQ